MNLAQGRLEDALEVIHATVAGAELLLEGDPGDKRRCTRSHACARDRLSPTGTRRGSTTPRNSFQGAVSRALQAAPHRTHLKSAAVLGERIR